VRGARWNHQLFTRARAGGLAAELKLDLAFDGHNHFVDVVHEIGPDLSRRISPDLATDPRDVQSVSTRAISGASGIAFVLFLFGFYPVFDRIRMQAHPSAARFARRTFLDMNLILDFGD